MNDVSEDIGAVKNIGPKSAEWLRRIGVHTRADLHSMGTVAAYLAVVQAGCQPSLNLLWALAAGLEDKHWTKLSSAEKSKLMRQLNRMRSD